MSIFFMFFGRLFRIEPNVLSVRLVFRRTIAFRFRFSFRFYEKADAKLPFM